MMPVPGGVDRVQGAAVERLAHGGGDVQQGLSLVLDYLISAHRFAG